MEHNAVLINLWGLSQSSQSPYGTGVILTPILQMKKLRNMELNNKFEVMQLVNGRAKT